MQEPDRWAVLSSLLAQGCIIDLEIMLWGWDAFKVMTSRQNYGYTWVPAVGQPPIALVPGMSSPPGSGLIPYDPANPPLLGAQG